MCVPPAARRGHTFVRRLYRDTIVDDRSAKSRVADEIDGDDELGAKRAAERDGDGIDERAIEQPAPIDLHRFENPGHGVGSPDGISDIAFGQPDFMSRADFGRDSREFFVEVLEA